MERAMHPVNQPATLDNAREIIAVASLLGRDGRTIESTIVGHSMERTLVHGSRVRIRCGLTTPSPGTVVVVAVGGVLFAHRIVGRGRGRRARDFIITRGDHAVVCDSPVATSWVVGVVTEYHDGTAWRPLPNDPLRSPARAWLAAVHRSVMLGALEIHVAVARGVSVIAVVMARALRPLTLFHRSDISMATSEGTPADPL